MNSVVSAITAFMILLILSLGLYRVNNENDRGKIAEEIITQSYQVVELKNDYIWNKNERAKEQWFAKHEQIGRLLKSASAKFRKPEDIKTLAVMLKDYESIGEIFSGIIKNREKAGLHVYNADIAREIENSLLIQLHMRSNEFVMNVGQLLDSNRETRESAIRVEGSVIFFAFVILGAANLINSRIMERNNKELQESEQRCRQFVVQNKLILESAGEGIFGLDLNGRHTFVNPAAAKMLGYATDELIGKHSHSTWHHTKPYGSPYPVEECPIYAAYTDGYIHRGSDEVFWRKDGTSFDVEYISTPIVENESIAGAVVTFTDITERKQLEVRIKQYSTKLEQSNRELDNFASIAAHDLGAPIRAVSGFAGLLQKRYKEKLGADADQYIANIVEGTVRMQNLIKDLLGYARAGTSEKPLVPVDINATIEKTLANLTFEIKESKAVISVDTLPTVYSDSTQLVQLFQNLVGNAIKYCSNTPLIHIDAERKDREWLFRVSDNGIGIDPRQFERIFQIFQRLHSIDVYSGTGIGLATCKKIVERLGGRIGVESKPGEGSIFFFTLPVTEL